MLNIAGGIILAVLGLIVILALILWVWSSIAYRVARWRRWREDREHVLKYSADWSHTVYCNLCLNSPLRKRDNA